MKLELADIADLRAYEREREAFRRHIIEIKRDRRVAVGPVVSITFENRETMRFQVQEMARAERMATDEAIQHELDTYNALIPDAGQLAATLFIELTSDPEMRQWLPKLVGIEEAVELRLGEGAPAVVVAEPEAEHAAQLTREQITASVHYLHFHLDEAHITRFATGPVALAVRHPDYDFSTPLSEATRASLLADLRGA